MTSPGLEPELEQDTIGAYVDRAAAIVGLTIAPEHRAPGGGGAVGATLAEVPTVQA